MDVKSLLFSGALFLIFIECTCQDTYAQGIDDEALGNAEMVDLMADMVNNGEQVDFVDDDDDDLVPREHPMAKRRWKDFWKKVAAGGRRFGNTLLNGAGRIVNKVASKNPVLGSVLRVAHGVDTRSKRPRFGNAGMLKRGHDCNL